MEIRVEGDEGTAEFVRNGSRELNCRDGLEAVLSFMSKLSEWKGSGVGHSSLPVLCVLSALRFVPLEFGFSLQQ